MLATTRGPPTSCAPIRSSRPIPRCSMRSDSRSSAATVRRKPRRSSPGCCSEHPDVPELNVVVGQIHAARGDFDAAVASLRRAVELKPDVPEANASLGDIYMRQGELPRRDRGAPRRAGGSSWQREGAQHAGDGARPGRQEATRRSASCGRSSRVKPNYADARYLFGKILLAQGAEGEAIGHLEVAARLAPEDANIHYQLGQAYQRLGRTELAARRSKRING